MPNPRPFSPSFVRGHRQFKGRTGLVPLVELFRKNELSPPGSTPGTLLIAAQTTFLLVSQSLLESSRRIPDVDSSRKPDPWLPGDAAFTMTKHLIGVPGLYAAIS